MTFQLMPDELERARTIGAGPRQAINLIVDAVSVASGIDKAQIMGPSRIPQIVAARHLVWWIAHCREGLSLAEIGRAWRTDHATVRNGVMREGERRGYIKGGS